MGWNLADFNWRLDDHFDLPTRAIILESGQRLRAHADTLTGGQGQAWMMRRLSGVRFHAGGLIHRAVSGVNREPTSVVFPFQDIWLIPDLTIFANPHQHVLHELAHVLDNRGGRKALPATWFGGGPADRLTRFAGGNPRGLRFKNGPCGIRAEFLFAAQVMGGYANTSTAEHFAESFAWSIAFPGNCPTPQIPAWMDAWLAEE